MSKDGILIVDKPAGLTSHDAVMRVKKALSAKKVGHTGTLDPFATGVLVMGINQGTKLIPFLDKTDKAYRGVIVLGMATDTYDSTGEIVERCDEADIEGVSEEDIRKAVGSFAGTIRQRPPVYSALKVDGVRLYKLARSGVTVDVEEREVKIFSIELVDYTRPRITIDATCSPGTYIRSLAVDIGKALGLPAHLEGLKRTRSGPFSIEESTALKEFAVLGDARGGGNGKRGPKGWSKVIGLREAVGDMMEISINEGQANQVVNGAPLLFDKGLFEDRVSGGKGDAYDIPGAVVKLIYNEKLLALARVVIKSKAERENKMNLKPFKVFH
ncbi:MAG: tRNA pseudouridine(55) synthase TruB [Deltaproteobacteria bacterium]|uniref:tRNA pseudouridine synthase B n=1 Tax=Candidatus Zymogenus saltonus TaxID=2844893 RepID=A0A9D8PR40_9DELT|nr:tRNA pseudouridine(55) synthase TruB [Candidatus Zymogenus saltonus]